ncbi:MAG: WG repeat-containing protein, partial [Muribaculaceae bacterium]|nr:WG repeat-containing protein [Muribaculaceae bacterium]
MYTLPVGTKITSPTTTYTITGVLGQGGFGITYSASFMLTVGTMKVKANVALKEHFVKADCVRKGDTSNVSCSDPARRRVEQTRKDFIGEARRLNRISGKNPNIVTVNEVFESNNTAYYAMEMIEGVSLRDYVASRGTLSVSETLDIMTPIVEAVAFLHRNRITHLDIKPQNIMIATEESGALRPVLIDFGLSKHYDENGEATSTLKTHGYSEGFSPVEQYAGITHFSPASDVYALAATMVFCLTGKRLPTAHEVTPKKLEAILPSTLPASLRSILMRSLSMHAEDRYADAAALLAAIEGDTLHDECGDDTTVVVEETLHDKPAKKSKQSDKPLKVKVVSAPRSAKTSVSGMKIALIVIAACLIVCGVAFLIWKSPSTPTQPQAVTDNPATSSTTDDDKLATYLNTISVQLNDVTTAEEFNAVLSEIEQKIQAYRDSQPNRVLTPEVKQALLNAQTALQNKAKELNLAPDLTAITELEQPQVQENAQQPQEQDAPKKEYADHDLSKIERNGQYGFADNEGNIIITCKYDYADSFSEGLAYVKKDGKYGYINKSGKEVIPLIYDWVGSFNDGLAVVKKDGQKGFVNKSGRIVIPLKYDNSHDCF